MKSLSIYKLGFLSFAVVLLGGLTGCVQQAAVSTHHSVGFDDRILISSNLAYYERYGYPAGYVRSYAPAYRPPPPRPVVVKKINVIKAKPHYRDDRRYKSRPVHNKPHNSGRNSRFNDSKRNHDANHRNVKQRHVNNQKPNMQHSKRAPVKSQSKPRAESRKPSQKPHKLASRPANRGLIDAVNQAKHKR